MLIPFTVVIPSEGARDSLLETIKSVCSTSYPKKKYQLILVDNSIDGIKGKHIEKLKKKRVISIIREKCRGPSFARNLGIKHAKFTKIIFIDDDCRVDKKFFHAYNQAWQEHPDAHMIGGKVKAKIISRQITTKESEFIKNSGWCLGETSLGDNVLILQIENSLVSANMSLDKGKFESFFDTQFGKKIWNEKVLFGAEDYELCTRLLLEKKKLVFFPKSQVFNIVKEHRFSQKYIFWRYFLTGIENYKMDQKFKKKFKNYKSIFLSQMRRSFLEVFFLRFKYFFIDYFDIKNWIMLTSYFLTKIGLIKV